MTFSIVLTPSHSSCINEAFLKALDLAPCTQGTYPSTIGFGAKGFVGTTRLGKKQDITLEEIAEPHRFSDIDKEFLLDIKKCRFLGLFVFHLVDFAGKETENLEKIATIVADDANDFILLLSLSPQDVYMTISNFFRRAVSMADFLILSPDVSVLLFGEFSFQKPLEIKLKEKKLVVWCPKEGKFLEEEPSPAQKRKMDREERKEKAKVLVKAKRSADASASVYCNRKLLLMEYKASDKIDKERVKKFLTLSERVDVSLPLFNFIYQQKTDLANSTNVEMDLGVLAYKKQLQTILEIVKQPEQKVKEIVLNEDLGSHEWLRQVVFANSCNYFVAIKSEKNGIVKFDITNDAKYRDEQIRPLTAISLDQLAMVQYLKDKPDFLHPVRDFCLEVGEKGEIKNVWFLFNCMQSLPNFVVWRS